MTRISQLFRSRGAHNIDVPPLAEPQNNPRIVILSASVGAGHVRAAQAIQSALTDQLPNATIAHVDVLSLTNGVFRRAYSGGYFRAIERTPHLVAMLYDYLDHPNVDGSSTTRLMFERLNFFKLIKFLTSQRWDLVINTHFLPAAIVSWMRRTDRIDVPQATVVTDFDVHGMWISKPCERYFVASDEAKANAVGDGVEADLIDVTGIPIDPKFSQATARKESDRPVVLQMAGGFGIGSIERIYQSICDISKPLEIIVVTGKNAEAKRQLETIAVPKHHRIQICGFRSDMHELMASTDVVVSKPGGLTTAESLASGCAMAIVEPIPGQEDRNSDFLLENGCAIKINNLASLTHKLGSLLEDEPRLASMKESARRRGRPRAASEIASRCLECLSLPVRR